MEDVSERLHLLDNENTGNKDQDRSATPTIPCRYIPLEVINSLYFVSFAVCFPIQQFYIYDYIGNKYGIPHLSKGNTQDATTCSISSDNSSRMVNQIQKEASDQFLYLSLASNIPSAIIILFLGSLSDKLGRKFFLLATIVGGALKQIVYVIVMYWNLSIGILYVGCALESLTGGMGATLMATFAIIADICPPGRQRAIRITVLEASIAVAIGLALLGAAFWLHYSNYIIPTLVILGLSVLNLVVCIIFIPETPQTRTERSRDGAIAQLTRCFTVYTKKMENRRWKLLLCLFCFFLASASILAKSSVWTLFVLHQPFCWSQLYVNIFSAVQICLLWSSSILFVKFLHHKLGDYGLILIGTTSGIVGMVLLALAQAGWWIYVSVVTSLFLSVLIPMFRAAMSHLVSPEEQGAMFAGIGSVEMLSNGIGGLAFNLIYKATVDWFPGFVFLVVASLLTTVFILSTILLVKTRTSKAHCLEGVSFTVETTSNCPEA
ncbi:hypothetical protein CHS0354_031080 [Potamilus streckersoni]|uniref:Major facilitator superfamily (MFS) profile domain-containing protein n=1 Tax=Potamilus streckersoni TaxID=2493646 RepID=A0AAE0S031_9BIVA|nr:hypothetical protein CHS0354_031080 [Potamilus streckersoni]